MSLLGFNHISIMLFLLSFHLIFNENIQIENFKEIFIKPGTTHYLYNYPGANKTDTQNSHFFFKFSVLAQIHIKIIEEDYDAFERDFIEPQKYGTYKIKNLNPQKVVFVITNGRTQPESLIFFDNSNEINTTLDNYHILVLSTNQINDKPKPIIFNIETIEYDTVMFIKEIYSVFEYCIMEGEECNYKEEKTQLIFKKGDKIKFKYNYSGSSFYCFEPIIFSTHITKPNGIGFNNYIISRTVRDIYLYIDIRIYNNFSICSPKYFESIILTEEKKEKFIFDGNKNNYFTDKDKYLAGIYDFTRSEGKAYLIIHRAYNLGQKSLTEYGFFYLFLNTYNLINEETFFLKNETGTIFRKKKDM